MLMAAEFRWEETLERMTLEEANNLDNSANLLNPERVAAVQKYITTRPGGRTYTASRSQGLQIPLPHIRNIRVSIARYELVESPETHIGLQQRTLSPCCDTELGATPRGYTRVRAAPASKDLPALYSLDGSDKPSS
jgi:hypothetical protein